MHDQTYRPCALFSFSSTTKTKFFLGPHSLSSIQQINVPVLKNEFDLVLYIAQWSENVYSIASREFTLMKRG